MLPHAERVEQAARDFYQKIEALRSQAVCVIRVTCPEPIVVRLKQSGLIDRFHASYQGLRVEFVMSDRFLDLMKGEADVALRSGDTGDGELVGRKIGDSLWAVYASRRYLEERGPPGRIEDLARHALIGFDDSLSGHRAAVWLRRVAPDAHFAARNNSVLGLVHSAKAGMGLAPLPLAIGDAEPDLVRVLGPIDELTRDLAGAGGAGAAAHAAGRGVLRFHRGGDRGAAPDPPVRAAASSRPGYDLAGTVLRAAAIGIGRREGTRVVGLVPLGSWARYVAIPVDSLAEKRWICSHAAASAPTTARRGSTSTCAASSARPGRACAASLCSRRCDTTKAPGRGE